MNVRKKLQYHPMCSRQNLGPRGWGHPPVTSLKRGVKRDTQRTETRKRKENGDEKREIKKLEKREK